MSRVRLSRGDDVTPDDLLERRLPGCIIDELRAVMVIHNTTFLKLIENKDELQWQLADFFDDAASTYKKLSKRLRRGPRD